MAFSSAAGHELYRVAEAVPPGPAPFDAPFQTEVPVASGAEAESQPSMAATLDGADVFIAYTDQTSPANRDVYVAHSTDDGVTWTRTPVAAAAGYNEFDPALVLFGTRVYVFFSQNDPASRFAVRWAYSADRGASWTVEQLDFHSNGPMEDFRNPHAADFRGEYMYVVWDAFCYAGITYCRVANPPGQQVLLSMMFDATGRVVPPSYYFPFGADTREPSVAVTQDRAVIVADLDATIENPPGPAGSHDIVWMSCPAGAVPGSPDCWSDLRVTGLPSMDVTRPDAAGLRTSFVLAYQYLEASPGSQEHTIRYVNTNDDGATYGFGQLAGANRVEYKDPALTARGTTFTATFVQGSDLGFARSSDGGASWPVVGKVNSNAPGTVVDAPRTDDVTSGGRLRAAWTDVRNGNPDIFYADAPGIIDMNPPLGPATPQDAVLTGTDRDDLLLTWALSPDDGGGENDIVEYLLYASTSFDHDGIGYTFLASLRPGSTSYWEAGAGAGDLQTRFYQIVAVDAFGQRAASADQFVKYARSLAAGTHLLSVPVHMSDTSLDTVLAGVDYSTAKTYVNNRQGKNWITRDRNQGGDFTNVDETQGFWLDVMTDSNLVVAGLVRATVTIHLYKGWNLVGYPSFLDRTVEIAFAGADLRAVQGFDPTNPPSYLRDLAPSDVLHAGDGIWLRARAPFDWVLSN